MPKRFISFSPTSQLPSEKKYIMPTFVTVPDPQINGTRVIIDTIGINEDLFYGSLTEAEQVFVWEKVLHRSMDEVFGMTQKRSLKRHFRFTFILNHVIDLKDIYSKADFVFRRFHVNAKSEEEYDSIHCTIVGYNIPKPVELGSFTRITATTSDFKVSANEILPWLALYGSVSTKFDYVKNSVGVRTDVIETEIRLMKHIPEYLPVAGKKIQIGYPGIPRMCIKCWGVDHLKRNCRAKKVEWIDHVAAMRATGAFSDPMFGSWIAILDQNKSH